MKTVNIYLNFNGNCEEAFNFYRSVFGGEFTGINRWSEVPPNPEFPPVPEEFGNKIMHMGLPISAETLILGADMIGEDARIFKAGNNFSVYVNAQSKELAGKLFAGLSAGGTITMPLADTFWGSFFGGCTDRFGVSWMVSYDYPQE